MGERRARGRLWELHKSDRDETATMIEGEERGDSGREVPQERVSDNRIWERIDAVCDRFEERWINDEQPRIEAFLPTELDWERELTFRELLKLDLDYRWRGKAPRLDRSDYASRFPEYSAIIEEEFELHAKTRGGGTTYQVPCAEERLAVAWFFEQFDGVSAPAEDGSGSDREEGGLAFPSRLSSYFRDRNNARNESRLMRRLRLWSQWYAEQHRAGSGVNASDNGAGGEWAIDRGERSDAWIRNEAENLPRPFGEYELLRVAGHGGMGVVYEAIHHPTARRVALKLVRRDRLEHRHREEIAMALSRFEQEARAAAGIDHEHWVRVYDVGEVDGQPYYSMQFVEGPSLAAMIRQGPLEGERAAGYLEPVARALAAAHRCRILHRDLKPHNILIRRDNDQALITDFGLAKLLDNGKGDTCTGDAFGSPSYVSPEQALDASRVDERSDIYGMGATLYHAITGRPPFQASSIGRVIDQVLHQEPIEPRQLNPHIDPDLETICLKCLAKEPPKRFATAEELADELRRYLEKRPIRSRPISRWGRTKRWAQRNPLPATLGGSVIVLLTLLFIGATIASWLGRASLQKTEQALLHERQAKEELTEALIEYVELVSAEPLLSEMRFQPLRESLLRGTSQRLDEFLSEPTRDDQDRSRVTQIWESIADVEFHSGRMHEARLAVEKGLQVLSQFDHEWTPVNQQTYFDLQLLMAEIEWESSRGEEALDRIEQLLHAESLARLSATDQAKIQIRADQLAVDIQLAWAEIKQAEQRLERMQLHLAAIPPDPSLDYALLASNVHERESRIHLQQVRLEPAILAAQQAVQAWNLPETNSLDELSKICRDRFAIEFPPPDYFRQVLGLIKAEWAKGSRHQLSSWLKFVESVSTHDRFTRDPSSLLSEVLLISRLSDSAGSATRIEFDLAELFDKMTSLRERPLTRTELSAIAKLGTNLAKESVKSKDFAGAERVLAKLLQELNDAQSSDKDGELLVAHSAAEFALSDVLHIMGRRAESFDLKYSSIVRLREAFKKERVGRIVADQYARTLAYLDSNQESMAALETRLGLPSNKILGELELIAARFPYSPIVRVELAKSRIKAKLPEYSSGRLPDGLKNELNTLEEMARSSGRSEVLRLFGQVLLDLAALKLRQNELGAARQHIGEAISVYEELVLREEWTSSHHTRLATAFCTLAAIMIRQSDRERAAKSYESADAHFGKATASFTFLGELTTEELGQLLVTKWYIYKLSNSPRLTELVEAVGIYQRAMKVGHHGASLKLVWSTILREMTRLDEIFMYRRDLELYVIEELMRLDETPGKREELEARREAVLVRMHLDRIAERRHAWIEEVRIVSLQVVGLWWRGLQREVLRLWDGLWSNIAFWRKTVAAGLEPIPKTDDSIVFGNSVSQPGRNAYQSLYPTFT